VYDRETVESAAGALLGLGSVGRVFFATKANHHERVLGWLYEAGVGFECVSPGELKWVRSLFPGLDPERLLFTPNFAPRRDYEFGLGMSAHVTVDNLHPLEAWPELFRGRDILVRLDPGQGRGHHAHVRTAGECSKFGVSEEQLPELCRAIERCDVRVVGLHAHPGSGILDAQGWAETARFLDRMLPLFPGVRWLDVGGGLGVPGPGQAPLDLAALDASLAGFAASCARNVELWLEPGRYLVAEAGVLLARVTQLKQKGPKHFVGVDAGMNSLIRPALYGAFHEIVNLSRWGEDLTIEADVVGPICESGDTLGSARRLPTTHEGDVLLIATAGAYGRVMSSSYNLRSPAEEVVLE
jgi:diaminopimelate decarboxylase/aspartate kinase